MNPSESFQVSCLLFKFTNNPIHLCSGGVEDLCFEAFSESQHINGTMDVNLGGLDRVILVMNRRCRTGEVTGTPLCKLDIAPCVLCVITK